MKIMVILVPVIVMLSASACLSLRYYVVGKITEHEKRKMANIKQMENVERSELPMSVY